MEATHRLLLLVTALVCATVLAVTVLVTRDGETTKAQPAGYCPPWMAVRDAC